MNKWTLINPDSFDYSLLNAVFNSDQYFNMYMAFDEDSNVLMTLFKDPKTVESTIFYINDHLAFVVNNQDLQIVGIWFVDFSKHWLSSKGFDKIRQYWDDIVKLGLLSKYWEYDDFSAKKPKQKAYKENERAEANAQILAVGLFRSREVKQEVCLAGC